MPYFQINFNLASCCNQKYENPVLSFLLGSQYPSSFSFILSSHDKGKIGQRLFYSCFNMEYCNFLKRKQSFSTVDLRFRFCDVLQIRIILRSAVNMHIYIKHLGGMSTHLSVSDDVLGPSDDMLTVCRYFSCFFRAKFMSTTQYD